MRIWTTPILAALLYGLLGITPASAEPYLSVYGGAAITADEDIDFKRVDVDGDLDSNGTINDVELDPSAVVGGKVGYFFGAFGLEAEAYHFSPEADRQRVRFTGPVFDGDPVSGSTTFAFNDPDTLSPPGIDVVAAAINALYRVRLAKDADFPNGRVNPYVGAGLGVFIATIEAATEVREDDDTDAAVGGQVLVGLKYFLTEHLSLFTEYKFIQTDEFEFDLEGIEATGTLSSRSELQLDITSHLIYAGIQWHF